MNSLFSSKLFKLVAVERTDKKGIPGIFHFMGLPSVHGSCSEVTALEDGVVIFAGRNMGSQRGSRRGIHVIVRGRGGVHIMYEKLAGCAVRDGDTVHIGNIIGYAVPHQPIIVELRRAGRRIDGSLYLGFSPQKTTFNTSSGDTERAIMDECKISEELKNHINLHPDADKMWRGLRALLTMRASAEKEGVYHGGL